MTDLRDLITEMAEKLDELNCHYNVPNQSAMIDRALAALAEPEPKGPTLDEIDDLCAEHSFCYEDSESLECLLLIITDALARWGRPAPEPADGEVAELVAWLRSLEDASVWFEWLSPEALKLTRAADLLEQRQGGAEEPSVAAPVPVSERLPGPELCWWFEADEDCGYGSNWTLLRIRGSATGYTHWLPAHALPLPKEVV